MNVVVCLIVRLIIRLRCTFALHGASNLAPVIVIMIALSIVFLSSFSAAHAQTTQNTVTVQTYRMAEITLTSAKQYAQPATGVDITCVWRHENGKTITVKGFWNGGTQYRVRFAPPLAGAWSYSVSASDTTNTGLHKVGGTLIAQQYQGDNVLYNKGFIKVSDDKRYLTYANGEPFFWLGDTAWEIVWKSRFEQASRYITDRKNKKFSVIQVVPMSHLYLFRNKGVTNRNNELYFLDDDYFKPNPRYFDYLDSLVQTMNDNGIIAVMSPLWSYFSPVNTSPWVTENLNREQSLAIGKYIAARYAGSHVMWIVAGDNAYGKPEQQEFWSTFARTLKTADGGQHLATVHPSGYGAESDYFANSTDWLDFNMYQSSHTAGGDFTWQAALRKYAMTPTKPTINGEACYEDIYHNLWLPGDTNRVATARIIGYNLRQASYESLLAGANVGITYGANGVWQWNTENLSASHDPRSLVDSAWRFPGSSQMTVLKDWLVRLKWYRFVPQPQRVVRFTSDDNFLPAAQSGDSTLVVYTPVSTRSVMLNLNNLQTNSTLSATLQALWICPTSGVVERRETVMQTAATTLTTPNEGDWLLVISSDVALSVNAPSDAPPAAFSVESLFPQPAQGAASVRVQAEEAGLFEFSVFDLTGRIVFREAVNLPPGKSTIPLSFIQAGAMVYRGVFTSLTCRQKVVTGTLVNHGK